MGFWFDGRVILVFSYSVIIYSSIGIIGVYKSICFCFFVYSNLVVVSWFIIVINILIVVIFGIC